MALEPLQALKGVGLMPPDGRIKQARRQRLVCPDAEHIAGPWLVDATDDDGPKGSAHGKGSLALNLRSSLHC